MIIKNVHENVFNEFEYSETASDMIRKLKKKKKNSYCDQQAGYSFFGLKN